MLKPTGDPLRTRTKQFALRVVRLVASLPRGKIEDMVAGQLLRAGTSVGSNYRAAARARSRADFVAKMGIVEEEADESLYWMEILVEAGIVRPHLLHSLMAEAGEILAMVVASIRTARHASRK
ncbi:MAG: four helix bundle protein [Planctomycetes bacterium]|nr:four helix bundle protein [Planctomycetota bacterium]